MRTSLFLDKILPNEIKPFFLLFRDNLMPHTNTWETDGLYRKFTGDIDTFEVLNSNFQLHEHPRFKDIKYIINDFIEVENISIEISHTEIFAKTDEMVANTKGYLKIALLITQEAHLPLTENYLKAMKENRFKCKVFTSIEDAREWVNK